ncbi:MAG: MCE family protein [Marmoricola sp.]
MTRPFVDVLRRPRRLAALIAVLLAGAVLLSGCQIHGAYDLPLPGNGVSSGDGYQVTADFRDVVNVVPHSKVMKGDVPVGQVDSVRRVGWHARVTLTVRNDIVLPRDAVADVRQTSLLGEKYIALLAPPGSSVAKDGRLGNGDFIPLSRTNRNPDVEEVLGALSFLLSGGGVGQLKTISSELNKMMDGRQADIRHLLGQIDRMVSSLDQQKSDIIHAMTQVNRLTSTLNREKRTIDNALDAFGPALRVLNNQHRSLMRMLHALDRLGVVGTRVINASKHNMLASLRLLAPVLHKLADAGNSLPRGLMMMSSFPFPKSAATLAKGDYSNALFDMDFDLNKALKGALQGGNTGLPNVSQLCAIYAGTESCGKLMTTLCSALKTNLFCTPAPRGLHGSGSNASTRSSNPGVSGLLQRLGAGRRSSEPGSGGGGGGGSSGGSGGLRGLLGGGG